MDYLKGEILKFMSNYADLARYYINIMSSAPPGKLTVQKTSANDQLLHCYSDRNRKMRKTVTHDHEMLRSLARKEFARLALSVVEHNQTVLQKTAEQLRSFDPDAILQSMSQAYKKLPEEYFFDRNQLSVSHHLDGETAARISRHEAWGRQEYKQTDYYAEYRRTRTSRGLYVRSKSEALIAESLYRYGIPFHYDEEIMLGEHRIAPDFSFEDEHGQLFFWEHMGMMDKDDYANRNFRKLAVYHAVGLLPGGRLLLSFDGDGTINMGTVDAIIRNEVIPRL